MLIAGNIGPSSDADVYRFTGKRGDLVSVICSTQGLTSSLDPLIGILDSASNAIAVNVQAGVLGQVDSFLQVVLPADGTYYVVVLDYYNGYGATGYGYRLHIRLPSGGALQ
jgi:hypothetical protein